jgi:hypothetical protein
MQPWHLELIVLLRENTSVCNVHTVEKRTKLNFKKTARFVTNPILTKRYKDLFFNVDYLEFKLATLLSKYRI